MTYDTHDMERRARALYQQRCEGTPHTARLALQRARHAALSAPPRGVARRLLVPAGGMAAAVLAITLGWQQLIPHMQARNTPARATLVATTNAPPELYQDLDFYLWLAQTQSVPARN